MTLQKKLFRDLFEHKGANLAAIVVIAIGIMMFVGASMSIDTLVYSKEQFYSKTNFPDGYARLISISKKNLSPLEDIEGIQKVEGRLIQDVKIKDTSITLRLISQTNTIAKYTLKEGRRPKSGNYEILLDNMFATKNSYEIGDTLSIISNGKKKDMRVCGIMYTAENIFSVKDASSIVPNHQKFGVAFTDITSLQNMTNKNFFNEAIFKLDKNTHFDDVKNRVEKDLHRYGLLQLYPQKDQISNIMVDGEIEEQKSMMVVMPLMFLSVAALVMSIMIKRIIEQQRGQIGILKAFGYSDFEVGLHYSSYCFVLGALGGILGSVLGRGFFLIMMDMYKLFFNMDFITHSSFSLYFIQGFLLSSTFSVLAGIHASRKAVQIFPCEAMRQETPKSAKKLFLEKLPFFDKIINSKGKMSIRNIFRNKKRSFFILLGIALAFSISILPWTLLEIMDEMVFDRYTYVEKYDVKIDLSTIGDRFKNENALNSLQGILKKESILEIPSTIHHRGIKENVAVVGLPENSQLYTIVDKNNQIVKIPSGGIVLSEKLAQKLKTQVGDTILFTSPYAKYKEDSYELKVSKIVQQDVGMNGYVELEYISKLLGNAPLSNRILLNTYDDSILKNIREIYQDSEQIDSIQGKYESIEQLNERMSSMYSSMYFMAFIAAAMTFSIVYNTFVVVLLEREREMSTLMVLGMKEKDVLSIITFEQNITSLIGSLLGIPIAKFFIYIMAVSLSNDSYTMPTTMKLHSILIASVFMLASILSAQILASRKVNTISIVDVLKSGE